MAGIAGIAEPGMQEFVTQMIQKINHRGLPGMKIIEQNGQTLGAVWPDLQASPTPNPLEQNSVWDCSQPLSPELSVLSAERNAFAVAVAKPQGIFMARDSLGVRPLYYGETYQGALCFASEVKALKEITQTIHEFPPGCYFEPETGFQAFYQLELQPENELDRTTLAYGLKRRLEQSICRRIDQDIAGCWLSGGLDSSVITALVRPHVKILHTFAGGFPGSPDLEYAKQVASLLNTRHHEVKVTLKGLLDILPKVIYHLESFDALLVRSTLLNYQVAELAIQYVGSAFSGEGGDELFAGYDYLKDLQPNHLSEELIDITGRLHNTALQRVDRSASAHGLVVYVPFLDPDVVEYALSIPTQYKIYHENKPIEKWILRLALKDVIPDTILWRPKSKFWQGSGLGELLKKYADEHISDSDFKSERTLSNGWTLNTKEELMYYRIFREYFGELEDLSWMGRTKGAPIQ